MRGALVAWSWIWLASHLCKPLCFWSDRLKAVMSLKIFIFHIQCSAHQEHGILARNCGMHGSLQPASAGQTEWSLQLWFNFSSLSFYSHCLSPDFQNTWNSSEVLNYHTVKHKKKTKNKKNNIKRLHTCIHLFQHNPSLYKPRDPKLIWKALFLPLQLSGYTVKISA